MYLYISISFYFSGTVYRTDKIGQSTYLLTYLSTMHGMIDGSFIKCVGCGVCGV